MRHSSGRKPSKSSASCPYVDEQSTAERHDRKRRPVTSTSTGGVLASSPSSGASFSKAPSVPSGVVKGSTRHERRFMLNFALEWICHGSKVRAAHGLHDFHRIQNIAGSRGLDPFRHQHHSVTRDEDSIVSHDTTAWSQHCLGPECVATEAHRRKPAHFERPRPTPPHAPSRGAAFFEVASRPGTIQSDHDWRAPVLARPCMLWISSGPQTLKAAHNPATQCLE